MKEKKYRFETLQVRAGQEIDPVSKGTAVSIYQSTAYTFDDMQYGAVGLTECRWMNFCPT